LPSSPAPSSLGVAGDAGVGAGTPVDGDVPYGVVVEPLDDDAWPVA
jgi:hypothetical protein